jgi:hypothetical protein
LFPLTSVDILNQSLEYVSNTELSSADTVGKRSCCFVGLRPHGRRSLIEGCTEHVRNKGGHAGTVGILRDMGFGGTPRLPLAPQAGSVLVQH